MERGQPDLPLTVQADLLSLGRASLFDRFRAALLEEVAFKYRIDARRTQYPFYGLRWIAAHLQGDGRAINPKAVQRQMRETGSVGIAPGPNLSW